MMEEMKPWIIDGVRMTTEEYVESQLTDLERTPYDTERYWELFVEDREREIAVLKEELYEAMNDFNNLNPNDEFFEADKEHFLWVIEDSSGALLVRVWELDYMYDSGVEMGNDEYGNYWLDELISVLVTESSYERVRELMSEAMKEFPKNPVRALARIPAWLMKEGELSVELTVEAVTKLTPYMSEVKE